MLVVFCKIPRDQAPLKLARFLRTIYINSFTILIRRKKGERGKYRCPL